MYIGKEWTADVKPAGLKEDKFLTNMFPPASKEKLNSLGLALIEKRLRGPIKRLPVTGRAPSSHGSTWLPPESLNKRIVSDVSLSKDRGVCEEKKKHKNTESVYEWNRLPVDRMHHMQPANTKMRTEIKNKSGN